MVAKKEILDKFLGLKVWGREGSRAPNKPLLVLLALANIQNRKNRLLSFNEIEKPLSDLLTKYGVYKSPGPQYPFWRLQNDGIWEVPNGEELTRRKSSDDVPITILRKNDVLGGFTQEIYDYLKSNPEALHDSVYVLLNEHFPPSIHDDIAEEIGFSFDINEKKKTRDPKFRERVLDAYGWSCAVCGFDLYLSGSSFGVEAAHIRWHGNGGPDIVRNGIALCTLHHKAFDLGVFTISEDMNVLISEKLHGGEAQQLHFQQFHQKKLIKLPSKQSQQPAKEYLNWHYDQVFKKPA